jgi:hypothetical protein
MVKKESILKILSEFPEEISIEDLIERLILVQKIEYGIQQSERGDILSEKEAKNRMRKWLK